MWLCHHILYAKRAFNSPTRSRFINHTFCWPKSIMLQFWWWWRIKWLLLCALINLIIHIMTQTNNFPSIDVTRVNYFHAIFQFPLYWFLFWPSYHLTDLNHSWVPPDDHHQFFIVLLNSFLLLAVKKSCLSYRNLSDFSLDSKKHIFMLYRISSLTDWLTADWKSMFYFLRRNK
jgi:hypothetical protein